VLETARIYDPDYLDPSLCELKLSDFLSLIGYSKNSAVAVSVDFASSSMNTDLTSSSDLPVDISSNSSVSGSERLSQGEESDFEIFSNFKWMVQ
jgi:hypothetical protein